MSNICWFQFLKCDDFWIFLHFGHSHKTRRLNTMLHCCWKTGIFHNSYILYTKNWLINKIMGRFKDNEESWAAALIHSLFTSIFVFMEIILSSCWLFLCFAMCFVHLVFLYFKSNSVLLLFQFFQYNSTFAKKPCMACSEFCKKYSQQAPPPPPTNCSAAMNSVCPAQPCP